MQQGMPGRPPLPQTTQPPLGSQPAMRGVQPPPAQRAQPGLSGQPGMPPQGAQQARRQRPAQAPRPQQARPARQPRPSREAPRQAGEARVAAAIARSRAWARPAGLGARLGAYSIDAAVCIVLAVCAAMLAKSALVGVLVLVEVSVILLVIEARTGATVGNLVLRQRTARDDAPFSPGVGRGVVRGVVQGAGSLVALIGGWVVVATSAADPLRMGRSWADRAGRTLVVKVPTSAEREAWTQNAEAWAQSSPRQSAVDGDSPAPVIQTLGASPAGALGALNAGSPGRPQRQQLGQAPVHQLGQSPAQPPAAAGARSGQIPVIAPQGAPPVVGGPAPAQPQPVTAPRHPQAAAQPPAQAPALAPVPHPVSAMPPGVVAVDAPIAAAPAPREVGTLLLLSFDTGQRAQLRVPTIANLGRRPDASDPEDQLVVVDDPDGSVSKTHLRLEYRGDSVWVTDLGSTNGSEMVDDTGEASALPRAARMRIDDGASVRIGQRSFTVATITGEL